MGFGMNSPQSPVLSPAGRSGNKIPSGYKFGQLQQFNPEQMALFKQLFSHASPDSYTSRLAGGDQSMFDEMEAPAWRQFSSSLGNIASRFSGMGMGARKSSGFQNYTTSAASNFAQDLQSKRQGLQQQAIKDLMGMGNTLLQQQPYEQFMIKKQPSQWGQIAGQLAGSIPGAITSAYTGGFGG